MLFTHPWIEELNLNLTAIRKIKRLMMNLTRNDMLEVSTIAYAVVYFEKIILKKHVHKLNRKLMAAVCVLLAVKFWEPSVTSESRLDTLIEALEDEFAITKKKLFSTEMAVFADLDFCLLVPIAHAYPHFVRLLADHLNMRPEEYAPITHIDPVTLQSSEPSAGSKAAKSASFVDGDFTRTTSNVSKRGRGNSTTLRRDSGKKARERERSDRKDSEGAGKSGP
uniref:Cyclin N-terminal domain-containing protein n=2 Tax=Eutreptiella gymnastica TaxID=73025 RepID=A0A7S1IXL0_9EUGL|mmetsp:Transcript_50869/g.90875  ORF Transcript_50869/g.90875 Transcript_50869/m.90875 type:complete len:223 (+) Transcript_50869:360-1028(+)